MKFNKLTLGLAAVGVVSLASAARADEKMSQVQTALSNTTLSGYVDTSMMWGVGKQHGGNTPPYTPGGATGDGFNLNGVDIALDKPMDEGQWSSGYHIEFNMAGGPGVDGVGANGVRQAYLALRTPIANSAIDWKIGTWDTIIGYESSSDPANANFTRSYGWTIEPTTHTGILGTYKVNDMVSFSAGVANSGAGNATKGTSGTLATKESQKAYMGSIALTAPDSWGWAKGATFNAGVIIADSGSAGAWGAGKTWLYAGATVPTPLQALKVGAAFDFKDYHDGSKLNLPFTKADESEWVAALYANYQYNDNLSFNVRGEYYDGSSIMNAFGITPGTIAGLNPGHTGEELTGTVQYKLWANVLSRAEIRWDHAAEKAFDTTSTGTPFAHKNEVLVALNLIYQF